MLCRERDVCVLIVLDLGWVDMAFPHNVLVGELKGDRARCGWRRGLGLSRRVCEEDVKVVDLAM